MSKLVLCEQTNSITTLTLNRPERHNSLVPELLREFIGALGEVGEARALVLQANGRSFSTGGDVRAFYDHRDAIRPYASEIVGLLNQAIEALLRFPAPTIVAVNGVVTGGSIGLVLACDLVLVSERGEFHALLQRGRLQSRWRLDRAAARGDRIGARGRVSVGQRDDDGATGGGVGHGQSGGGGRSGWR